MGFGPPVGFGGANSVTASRDAGLPHAGVPGHLQANVDAVLEREPDHPDPAIRFHHRFEAGPDFSLRSFLWPHRWRLAGALALVILESVALQAGPLLTQIGIDDGVLPGNRSVLVVAALLVVLSAVGSTWARSNAESVYSMGRSSTGRMNRVRPSGVRLTSVTSSPPRGVSSC